MAKYYAKEHQTEYFDFENYFNEDDAVMMNFWAGGNRDFGEINHGLIAGLLDKLADFDYDCETDESELEDEDEKLSIEDYLKNANNYFEKSNGSQLTEKDLTILLECRSIYSSEDDEVVLCKLLEMIYDKPFKCGYIRGCSQGDWLNYICPEDVTDETISYIEAVLFATGTEYEITYEPIDSAEDFDSVDTFWCYTDKYKIDDVKEWLAKVAIGGCEAEDVKLLRVSNSYTTTSYEYSEE